jgi:surface protein
MESMFDGCWSLISLDLSNFDTSNVKDMNFMFYMNRSLKYLNLNNFDTSLVSNMHNMFYNCYSLKYINLNSFVERSGLSYSNMFFNFSKNTVYCINENKAKNLSSEIYNKTINNNCFDNCFLNNFEYDIEKNLCINYNIYKSLNCEKYYKYDMTGCLDYIPSGYYLIDNELRIIDKCPINEFFDGSCGFTNETSSVKDKDDIIAIIQNDILSGNIVKLLNISEDGQAKDLTIKNSNILYTITTSKNQNNNANKNESIIKLGECEKKLRTVYNMSDNSSVIIFKIDIYEENFLIPIIEYEVYNPETNQKLELENCQGSKISISIPVQINEDNLFKYNSSSDYYNDICYVYTSEKGTDISLNDRINEYNNNKQSLCEVNCDYNGYNNNTKKA